VLKKSMGSKWEIGKQYKTLGGDVVQIACLSKPGDYSILGFNVLGGHSIEWTDEGCYFKDTSSTSRLDLTTEEYKEPEYTWLNVYDFDVTAYSSKNIADGAATSKRRGRIKMNVTELYGRWDD